MRSIRRFLAFGITSRRRFVRSVVTGRKIWVGLILLSGCVGSTLPAPTILPTVSPSPTSTASPAPKPTASLTPSLVPSPTSPPPTPTRTPALPPTPTHAGIGPLAAPSRVRCAIKRTFTDDNPNGTHSLYVSWQDNSTAEDSFALEISSNGRQWRPYFPLDGQAGIGPRDFICCQFFPSDHPFQYVRLRACRADGTCSPPSPSARCEVKD